MILHLTGPETQGGAYQAAQLAVQPGDVVLPGRCSAWQTAYRTIGGYRSQRAEWAVRWAIRRYKPTRYKPTSVILHNFKSYGTGAIAACLAERVPVVWYCYDYWPLCPRDTLYNPAGVCDQRCISCYRPKSGRWPRLANIALVGRRKRLLRWLNRLSGIRALSQDSARLLAESGVSVPISVIPLMVKVPAFHVERIPGRVLFAGWQAPNKGLHVFKEACRLVRYPIDAKVIGLNRDGTGGLSRTETLREIAQASCLVVPEQWPNPQPIVVEEALQLGTPVVASRIGGLPEQLRYTGRLCPPDSPVAFARAIEETLEEQHDPTSF